MEIASRYNPHDAEEKWYDYWMKNGFFRSIPDEREPYTIVIPPPNVTGVLHMGHVLNNTIQDILVRRARMTGKNACWVPGTDHASIATEARVVAMLREKGIKKSDLSRNDFLKHAWEWKEKYGGIILQQLKKLGCSCDWDRTRFTMEGKLSDAVLKVFDDLYNKGYIYRGFRMINWDPAAKTALSDEEVIYKEVNSKFYYVKYKINGSTDHITIATTRPETILGDTAVCVNPNDKRYSHLFGKHAVIPLVNRIVPIIFDDYVDMEFGTGALKVTPGHDFADYDLGQKHHLEVIEIFNEDGTLNEKAQLCIGEERFAAREKIVKDLASAGHLEKTEDIVNKVGYSERTNAVIEPRLSLQWFLKMEQLAKPALDYVVNGTIKLIPDKFINSYRHWMENVHDWCISRQLWWGHRIPAWYCGCEECNDVVMVSREKPEKCTKCNCSHKLRQDEDVLDTWFSSWLWPLSVFDHFSESGNKDISYYYPTNDLVTAPEILFFWVARMIMAGYEYRNERPFRNVYLTGTVRDKQGRKMSKSLGNSPEPLELIKKYGADGVRLGMMLCSPAGNDLLFDESLCEQGRNFCNKIWNAFRLVKSWCAAVQVNGNTPAPKESETAARWFESRMHLVKTEIENNFSQFRISDALMSLYKLVWDDFCSTYLELVKPGKPDHIHPETLRITVNFFDDLLRMLHPFIPFITEEIWQQLKERKEGSSIMMAPMNPAGSFDPKILQDFEYLLELISALRNFRKEKNIGRSDVMKIFLPSGRSGFAEYREIIMKFSNIAEVIVSDEVPENGHPVIIRSDKYFISVPVPVDRSGDKEKLLKELEYTKGFLISVARKLSNEKFIQHAVPEVLEKERKKKIDAEMRIRMIEEQLAGIA